MDSLDPQTQALTQAIQQHESGGNYQDIGDGGTSKGAYQWQPGTWETESKKYLGADAPTSPLEASPVQQNKVAYGQVSSWKSAGYTPPQIASMWNAGEGEPNAYTGRFSNGSSSVVQGKFDVPSYTSSIKNNYDSLIGSKPMTTSKGGATTPPPDSSETSNSGNGFGAALAALGLGAGALFLGQPELLPEAGAEAASAAGEFASSQGANVGGATSGLGNVMNGIKGAVTSKLGNLGLLGGAEGIANGLANKVLGNNSANAITNAGNEEAQATENAGAEEANATQQAEQKQSQEQEATNAQAEANTENAQTKATIENSSELQNAYKSILNQTTGGTRFAQTPDAEMGINHLASYGVTPGMNDEGTRYVTQEQQDDRDNENEKLDTIEEEAHAASEDKGSLMDGDIIARARSRIDREPNISLPDREAAYDEIEKQMEAYKNNMGDSPTLGREGIGRIRRDGYAKWDATSSSAKNNARKALGGAANDHMLHRSSSPELIQGLHKEKEKNIKAKEVLKKLDGQKILEKKGLLQKTLHSVGKMTSLYIGDKIGGPIGAVIAETLGNNIIKAVDKRHGKSIFEKPAMRKILEALKTKNPDIYAKVEKKLKQYGVDAEARNKQPIPQGGKTHEGYSVDVNGKKTSNVNKGSFSKKAEVQKAEPKLLPASTASGRNLPASGVRKSEKEKSLGLHEVKNAVKNRTTNMTMSQGLSKKKAEGR